MFTERPTVLITGASSGIGAIYADRFAHRGHNLVLVARDETRMRALASRLEQEAPVTIDILKTDPDRRRRLGTGRVALARGRANRRARQ